MAGGKRLLRRVDQTKIYDLDLQAGEFSSDLRKVNFQSLANSGELRPIGV
jgi:hypothetical protein